MTRSLLGPNGLSKQPLQHTVHATVAAGHPVLEAPDSQNLRQKGGRPKRSRIGTLHLQVPAQAAKDKAKDKAKIKAKTKAKTKTKANIKAKEERKTGQRSGRNDKKKKD